MKAVIRRNKLWWDSKKVALTCVAGQTLVDSIVLQGGDSPVCHPAERKNNQAMLSNAHLREVDLHEDVVLPVLLRQRRQIIVQVPPGCRSRHRVCLAIEEINNHPSQ